MRLMKESKGAKILINIRLEENKFKHFLGFRKKFKRLQLQPYKSSLNGSVIYFVKLHSHSVIFYNFAH